MIEEVKEKKKVTKQLVLQRFIEPYCPYGKSGHKELILFSDSLWKNALENEYVKYSISELIANGWKVTSVTKAFFQYNNATYGMETAILEKEESV